VQRLLIVVVLCGALCAVLSGRAAAGPAMIYQGQIKPALALVEARLSDGTAYGTAFCISSSASGSYFLTNHHVVYDQSAGEESSDVSLIFPSAPAVRVPAKIVKSGAMALASEPPDLDVLFVRKANVKTVTFSAARALEAQSIGIAGFPAFQLEVWKDAKELEPTVSLGSVNGLNLGNYYVQYDAKTDHGNSGGPVFDSLTGYVLGVVDVGFSGDDSHVNNYLAISQEQARHFLAGLSDVHVAVEMPSPSELAKRLLPAHAPSPACQPRLDLFAKRFGEWSGAHTIAVARLAQHGAAAATVANAVSLEGARADALAASSKPLRGRRAKLAADIVAAVRAIDTTDHGGSVSGSATGRLRPDVAQFDALQDCR